MEAVVLLSIIPGRKEASERSEMTTQLLFGERLVILDRKDDWAFVESRVDGYTCWVNNLQIRRLSILEAQ
ncbi:MAG: hypothetical protein ACPF8V_09830, partial [Luteibaculum sp.]